MEKAVTETGAIQYGDDWPGDFIRGDQAFNYARTLQQSIDNDEYIPASDKSVLCELVALLDSCNKN